MDCSEAGGDDSLMFPRFTFRFSSTELGDAPRWDLRVVPLGVGCAEVLSREPEEVPCSLSTEGKGKSGSFSVPSMAIVDEGVCWVAVLMVVLLRGLVFPKANVKGTAGPGAISAPKLGVGEGVPCEAILEAVLLREFVLPAVKVKGKAVPGTVPC